MSGVVVDRFTGDPIPGARYTVARKFRTSYTDTRREESFGRTRDDGTFRFTYIADALHMSASHPGYIPEQAGTSDGRSKHGIVLRLFPDPFYRRPATQTTP
jgi:hypothetical protein